MYSKEKVRKTLQLLRLNWFISAAGFFCLSNFSEAQFTYFEGFTGTTAPGWTFLQKDTTPGPRLTAGTAPVSSDPETGTQIDSSGNGWLRLGTTNNNQDNAVTLDSSIPSLGNEVSVTFDFAMWDDQGIQSGGDGISVFLYDADIAFDAGANGGSISYAQKTGVPGLDGGYVGVALDVFGNYSNATEGRTKSDPNLTLGGVGENPGFTPNAVALRGPDDSVAQDGSGNFYFLAGTGNKNYTTANDDAVAALTSDLDFSTQSFRPDQDATQFRRFQMVLDSNDLLAVKVEFGKDSGFTTLFTADLSSFTRPDNLRIGFGSATGAANQVYEVRNLEVTATAGPDTWFWTDVVDNNLWNNANNWNPTSVPEDFAKVVFSDSFSTTDTDDTISVDGADKKVEALFFSGTHSYTLNPSATQKIIFDSNTAGRDSEITILNNSNGNADHTVSLNIDLNNDLNINNLVNQSLTLSGNIDTNGNAIAIDSVGTATLSGVVSDSGAISKKGNGKAVLSGNNAYTGATTVTDGILRIENANALGGTGTGTTVSSGGTLALKGGISVAAEPLNIAGSGEGGIGALTNTSGSNTWTGTVDLTADATIGAQAGDITFSSSATIDGNGNAITVNPDTGTTLTFNGDIFDSTGTSNLVMDGAGKAVLTVNNNYSGTTTVNDGTLQIENGNALGDTSSGTTINSGGTLALSGGISTPSAESLTLSSQGDTGKAGLWTESGNNTLAGAVTLSGGGSAGANGGSDQLTLSGVISGAGEALTVEGSGTVVLSGNNTYTGATNIDSGTLQLGAADRISNSSAVVAASGATFDLNDFNDTVGSLAGAGNVTLGSGTLTAGGDNTDTTFSGMISGTGGVTKQGTGTLSVSGANTFTGTIEINAGAVKIAAQDVFADASDLILDGGTLSVGGFSDTLDNFTLQSDSTVDFLSTANGFLTFDAMTRTGGNLTIDNWMGSLSGNGDTRLQVTASSLGGSLQNNIIFTGWGGAGSTLVDLGGGFFEIVPDTSGFKEWDSGGGNQNWNTKQNWVGDKEPAKGANVLFDGLTDAPSETINLNNKDREVTVLAITTDSDLTFTNNKKLKLKGGGGITVTGGGTHLFSTDVELKGNASINHNGTQTVTFDVANDMRLKGKTLTVTGSGTTVMDAQISKDGGAGTGALIKNGTGILELNNNNIHSSGTTLNAGTLRLGDDGAVGTGTFTINGGTIQATGGNRNINENLAIGGSFSVTGSNDLTFSGTQSVTLPTTSTTITVGTGVKTTFDTGKDLAGTGGLVKAGTGTLELLGNDTNFSGGLTVNAGTVTTGAADQLVLGSTSGGNNYLGSGDITVNTGGTLTAVMTGGNDITLSSGGTLTNNGGTVTLTNNNSGADFKHQGTLDINGGTTTVNVGDDFNMAGGASIDVSAGTLTINPDATFVTSGSSGNTASISVSGTGTLNVDLSGTGGTGNQFLLDRDDAITLDGSGAAMNITGETATPIDLEGTLNLNNGSLLTVLAGETNLDATTLLNGGTGAVKGTLEVRGDLNVQTPQMANDPNITINVSGASEIASQSGTTSFEDIGILTKKGAGTTTINANVNNIQADLIDIQAGTLLNGDNNQIENNTPMQLSGGTWDTGGFDEVLDTLTLTADSVIDLNSGDSIIEFDDSSSASWTAGTTVFIDNWSGNLNSGGTDQLIFSSAGLTSTQLSQIVFRNPAGLPAGNYAAILIGDEVVPVPEPSTYIGASLLLLLIGCRERKRLRHLFSS